MTPDSSDSKSDSRASLTEGVWWFDANCGRRLRASLHFADGMIRAENENGGRRDARLSEANISPRIGSAPRKITFADGVCISADDNDFIDAMILKHGGGRKNFILHLLEAKWPPAIAVIVAAWLFLSVFLAWGVPAIAEFGAHRVPREQVAAIGDQIYAQLRERELVVAAELSPAAAARAETIFNEVAAALSEEGDDFRLHLHHFSPNVFALPGGRIVVSDSLVELLDDDELAAVFAHEIGHIRRRHGMRGVLLGSAGGLIAVFSGDVAGVSLGAILLNLGYSREHEREADCFAYEYLRRNGMSAALIGDALEKMERGAPGETIAEQTPEENSETTETSVDAEPRDNLENLFRRVLIGLSTHPATEERKDLASACGAS